VAVFSLEMSALQVTQRLVSLDSAGPVVSLRDGKLAESEWAAFLRTLAALEGAAVWVDDTPGATPAHVRAGALRVRAASGLDLVVVDYLQLMRSGHRPRGRYEEVTEISQSLKALAKDLHVPVLALSQLSRECESRADKHPVLSDLRESGSLEQDADVVAFLYRDVMYDPDTLRPELTEVNVAKHRNGPPGKLNLVFQPGTARFVDADLRTVGDWL
jgi:replicative DNA helicase